MKLCAEQTSDRRLDVFGQKNPQSNSTKIRLKISSKFQSGKQYTRGDIAQIS